MVNNRNALVVYVYGISVPGVLLRCFFVMVYIHNTLVVYFYGIPVPGVLLRCSFVMVYNHNTLVVYFYGIPVPLWRSPYCIPLCETTMVYTLFDYLCGGTITRYTLVLYTLAVYPYDIPLPCTRILVLYPYFSLCVTLTPPHPAAFRKIQQGGD